MTEEGTGHKSVSVVTQVLGRGFTAHIILYLLVFVLVVVIIVYIYLLLIPRALSLAVELLLLIAVDEKRGRHTSIGQGGAKVWEGLLPC